MCSLVLIFEARPCLPVFPELRKGLSPGWPPHASSDAMDAMNDADANTDADDPGTRYENAPADSRPAYERAALLWQGKCLWCQHCFASQIAAAEAARVK
jgi:hypothetical protein